MKNLVDAQVVKLAETWQKALIANLGAETVSVQLMAVQLTLAILVLHLWGMRRDMQLGQSTLQQLCEHDDLDQRLSDCWRAFCDQTDQNFLKVLPIVLYSDLLSDSLIKSILGSLYYPKPAQFRELSVAVLALVYEQSLAKTGQMKSRKSGGIYYTPQPIVDYVVRSTVGSQLSTAIIPQILDPSCGGGIFLVSAYEYLLDNRLARTIDNKNILSYIHGVDIDPTGVAITQISLWLKSIEKCGIADQRNLIWQQLKTNIRCGNAVVDSGIDAIGFSWQRAFPKILANGGFDLVVGNPPYMDAELMSTDCPNWRTYCAQHYQTATGNWDLFCIFIEKALQLCRLGGLTSLVVPNKLLSADYATATRQLLIQTSQLQSIRDYSNIAVFRASVYPIVYITRKTERPQGVRLTYEKMVTIEQPGEKHWMQIEHPTQPWLVTDSELMQRLGHLPKLGSIVAVSGAATVAEAYALKDLIQNCPAPQSGDLRLVNSGTIDRYRSLWGQKRLRYLGQTYQHPIVSADQLVQLPPKRLRQARQPKIIVAGMSQRLECLFDHTGEILAGKSTSVIGSVVMGQVNTVDLRYLLGLLNSRLLSFYLLSRFSGNQLQGGYLRIGPPQLRQLPIVVPEPDRPSQLSEYEQIINLVDQIMNCDQARDTNAIQMLDAKIDALVYQLYQLSPTDITQVEALIRPEL